MEESFDHKCINSWTEQEFGCFQQIRTISNAGICLPGIMVHCNALSDIRTWSGKLARGWIISFANPQPPLVGRRDILFMDVPWDNYLMLQEINSLHRPSSQNAQEEKTRPIYKLTCISHECWSKQCRRLWVLILSSSGPSGLLLVTHNSP